MQRSTLAGHFAFSIALTMSLTIANNKAFQKV